MTIESGNTGNGEIQSRESHGGGRFYIESISGGNNFDEDIKEDLLELVEETFTPVLDRYLPADKVDDHVYGLTDHMSIRLRDPRTQVILLKHQETGELAGFTFGYPALLEKQNELNDQERTELKLSPAEYTTLQQKTISVGHTIIKPAFRHQGGWSLMMNALDEHISTSGLYTDMVRTVVTTDSYADKVKRRYKNRGKKIEYETPINDMFGPQLYFRIKL